MINDNENKLEKINKTDKKKHRKNKNNEIIVKLNDEQINKINKNVGK